MTGNDRLATRSHTGEDAAARRLRYRLSPGRVAQYYAGELQQHASTARIDEIARGYALDEDPARYERFLTALLVEHGIDYEAIRQAELVRGRTYDRLVRRARHAPALTLWAAAQFGRFAVCAEDGTVISRGHLPRHLRGEDLDEHDPDEHDVGGEGDGSEDAMATALADAQSELVAHHAIRIAGRARAAAGLRALRLRLILSRRRGIQPARLRYAATREVLVLDLDTNAHGSPAAAACLDPTPVPWRHYDLTTLHVDRSGRST
ncbi:hypothetical protein IU469_30035 [Nocardia puris]|uniref:Uncharacterized protein n=1 Tax=Nocardia puris TaxID=208602 RepID=A0A366D5L6_9NOCA|nr:hypothetical protein [Nocardia puris]MBF6215516.1 hypothetical protein [Nocardia puris]MBF6369920.1 hypothetical protein [Nocardia puris]RBO85320.1 hypothetical protein DFR74_115168 [Nocardia puris]